MAEKRLVWDLPLRAFHWLLVLCIVGMWVTAKADADYMNWLSSRVDLSWMEWHFRIGYGVIGLLLFRLIWGVIGPRHARFASFLPGPARLAAYVKTVLKRDSTPTVGHNPAGAIMVVVMLGLIGTQAFTGLFTSDDIVWSGPYFPAVSAALSTKMGGLHHEVYEILLWVLGLHIAAIVFYRVYKRQNLVSAMISGTKPASQVPANEAIPGSELVKALIVALVCAGAVYALVHFAPPPPELEY